VTTHELALTVRGPFSLSRTSARFARLGDVVNVVEPDGFARLVPAGRSHVLVRIAQDGPVTRASLRVRIAGARASSAAAVTAAQRVAHAVLGAGADLRPFERALKADPLIGASLRALRGLRVAGSFSLFEALVSAVLAQQVNLRFAFSIRAELVHAFGERAQLAGRMYHAFPSAARLAEVTDAELRGFRLSNAKAGAIARIARACRDGEIDEASLAGLSDEDAIAHLSSFKGIGRWSAEVALMRGQGRLDIFPAGDLAVAKRLAAQWLPNGETLRETQLRAFSERWRPFRSLAVAYGLESLAAAEPPDSR
jgi:DNA-3-methyladenine glycosylase II